MEKLEIRKDHLQKLLRLAEASGIDSQKFLNEAMEALLTASEFALKGVRFNLAFDPHRSHWEQIPRF